MSQFIWDNPSNYRKCQKKQYDIHVCMPPKGTIVINVLEQADTVKYFNGKTYFTLRDLAKLSDNAKQSVMNAVSCGKAYMVNDNTPFVLAGTCGELWCIDANNLAKKYSFVTAQGTEPINQQTLQKRMKNGYLDWTVVRTIPNNSQAWACFVKQSIKGQIPTSWGAVLNINGAGVSHGKGDFVIAGLVENQPDLSNRYVVNGNTFATTYDNRGWTDCINTTQRKTNLSISELPKLCVDTSSN